MAAARNKTAVAIGSTQWVQSEREQLNRLVDQEVEDFGYAARNELEWLNEHMGEIFSQSQKNLTDVFKTPGKLRGKTPRTARKKDPQRAPLTDLFAPNPQAFVSPARSTPFFQKVSKMQVATQDDPKPATSSQRSPVRTGKENTDSGYHGMTEDEMDMDPSQSRTKASQQQLASPQPPATHNLLTIENRIVEDSFVSATEAPELPINSAHSPVPDDDDATIPDEDMQSARMAMNNHVDGQRQDDNEISIHEDEPDLEQTVTQTSKTDPDTISESSSPDKPILRKSSLNFASLPPRETLAGKLSMGQRTSQVPSSTAHADVAVEDDEDDVEEDDDMVVDAAVTEAAAHNKTSTQQLHERINMLGQTREPRLSKSIPATYPILPQAHSKEMPGPTNDDDDEWIAPISNRSSGEMTEQDDDMHSPEEKSASTVYGHQKSKSTATLASPDKMDASIEGARQKSKSVSVPNPPAAAPATTPTSSPRRAADGPLSASKTRLYAMLKSAKGMFASSAGASAQAKLEASALQSSPSKGSLQDNVPDTSTMPGGFADDAASMKTATTTSSRPFSAYFSPSKDGKRTRSSTESDRKRQKEADDAKEAQKSASNLDKMREKERKKATQQKDEREKAEQERQQKMLKKEKAAATNAEPMTKHAPEQQVPELKSAPSESKLRAPGRLVKPARQAPSQPARPVPVNIRVASQSQRLGPTQASGSGNAAQDNAASGPERPPSAGGRPAFNRSGSSAPAPNARLKALEAAARKKEREEQAAAKKAETKRELERKRAAKLEDDRKAEQDKKAEEQRKAQEVKQAAQKQAEQRRAEQQRREAAAAAAKAKAEAEMAEALALERERAKSQAAMQRSDVPGTIRQLTKSLVHEMPTKNANAKRPLQRDPEEPVRTSTLNRGGMPAYQQQDAKRRRTDDEEDIEMRERHSVMAPPKRPSNMRKDTVSKFPHGYAHAPPPAAHHAQNIYKASIATQPIQANKSAPMQPHETIKLSTARIPFAENANPPASHPESSTAKTPTANGTFKTPARPLQNHHLQSAKTRSSPAYPNGDAIALPEINTDSEDSDSEAESPAAKDKAAFRAPSWVASPALRDLLTQQQLVDPESVFGPIASLNMDEVFRAGTSKEKDRLRRYRERGESAMWVESGDAVTSAEKRRDREMRERVMRDGGWSFSRDG